MMIVVNRNEDSINGSVNGKPFGVKYTEEKYKRMLEIADKANSADSMDELNNILADFEPFTRDGYKEHIETKCPYLVVNEESGKFYLKTVGSGKKGAEVIISSKPLPQALVDRILLSAEKGIDFLPIVKCWTRFLRNPNYSENKARLFANYINKTIVEPTLMKELMDAGVAPAVATERATVYQTPITNEGLICTYKVSEEVLVKYDAEKGTPMPRYKASYDEDTGDKTEATPAHMEDRLFRPAVMKDNGDAFLCYPLEEHLKPGAARHFIKVGRVHALESWDQVNCNDGQTGVKGLHCGNLEYIAGWQHSGTTTHNTFVDPMDIGAVTNDGSGALRVLRYFTHSSTSGINRSIYHSSSYASMTDLQWEEYRVAAIKAAEEKEKELKGLHAEAAAL